LLLKFFIKLIIYRIIIIKYIFKNKIKVIKKVKRKLKIRSLII